MRRRLQSAQYITGVAYDQESDVDKARRINDFICNVMPQIGALITGLQIKCPRLSDRAFEFDFIILHCTALQRNRRALHASRATGSVPEAGRLFEAHSSHHK